MDGIFGSTVAIFSISVIETIALFGAQYGATIQNLAYICKICTRGITNNLLRTLILKKLAKHHNLRQIGR